MKHLLFFYSIALFYSIAFFSTSHCHSVEVFPENSDAMIEQMVTTITKDCDFSIQQITQFSLTPFTITQPGLYCLGSDLLISATQATAIIIDSDNVILDLNDKTIFGVGLVNGIRVTGRNSVLIRNGKIANMGLNGVFITPFSLGFSPRNVLLADLFFINNGTGINLSNGQNCGIVRCAAFNSTNTGFSINLSTNTRIYDCIANNNSRGFLFTTNTSLFMNNCLANTNSTEGFSQIGGFASQYHNCTANQNTLGFSNTNSSLANQSSSAIYEDCYALFNRASGFFISGNHHTLNQCSAIGNNNNGFAINGTNHTIIHSQAKDNTNIGFALIPATSNTVTATGCLVLENSALGNGVGFADAGTTNRFYGNYALNNFTGTTLNNYSGISNVIFSPSATAVLNHTANISQ